MNSVNILGFLREIIDEKFRYFEYEPPFSDENYDTAPRIVVKYWTDQPNSRLSTLPNDTFVAIHGHLDNIEKFGTILLVEQLEVVK